MYGDQIRQIEPKTRARYQKEFGTRFAAYRVT
jgi:hypothetical protein